MMELVQDWWPVAIAVVAVYVLHVYRRARLTEPPSEAKGGFWREVRAWATIDARRTLALAGGVLGGVAALGKLAGFSVMAILSLDPVVITDLVAIVLAALHLNGVQLPPMYWAVAIAAVFAASLYVGDYWSKWEGA